MSGFLSSSLAGWLSIIMMAIGSGVAVWIMVADEESFFHAKWNQYVAAIEAETRFLFLQRSAKSIVQMQAAAVIGILVLYQLTGQFLFLAFLLAALVFPLVWLRAQRGKRIEMLEEQLDGWLLMLANTLKATPAIAEAMRSTIRLVQEPMQQEVDLIVKENQLGTPLDQALMNAANRIKSPTVGGSLAMLVVARQTGGDLPTILETSAGSLREMARLEGVVRTKTAEGKGQVWVLGSMPWLMALALSQMDETWWPALSQTFTGNVIITVAFIMWSGAILWGRKILAVDI